MRVDLNLHQKQSGSQHPNFRAIPADEVVKMAVDTMKTDIVKLSTLRKKLAYFSDCGARNTSIHYQDIADTYKKANPNSETVPRLRHALVIKTKDSLGQLHERIVSREFSVSGLVRAFMNLDEKRVLVAESKMLSAPGANEAYCKNLIEDILNRPQPLRAPKSFNNSI